MHPHVRIGVGRPPPARRPMTASSPQPPPPTAPGPAASIDRSRVRSHNNIVGNRFVRPPQDPSGILCGASDRPLLCCSLHKEGRELVVGSADHALYCYDARSGRPTRRLYGARHGHIDWVAAVAHLPDGRVLSGGGDGKLCLWPRASTATSITSSSSTSVPSATCQYLDGHASAVSKVAAVPESARLAFSAGYDGTVKLWDTVARWLLTCLDAGRPSHNALDPVTDFAFGAAHLLSGTRRGALHLWDLASGALLSSVRAAHQSQVTCVLPLTADAAAGAAAASSVSATGGQDGRVRIWDTRAKAPSCVNAVECHADAARGTTAAVGCLEAVGPLLCSGGADGRVCVLDSRAGFRPLHTFDHHHRGVPVYALKSAVGGAGGGSVVLFSGGGDGMLLAYDLGSMTLCYGMHANQGAVRCLGLAAAEETVVAAGEDGKALLYRY